MEKLKDLWVDDGTPISNSERLLKINLNQIIIANKVDELVVAFEKLKEEVKDIAVNDGLIQ